MATKDHSSEKKPLGDQIARLPETAGKGIADTTKQGLETAGELLDTAAKGIDHGAEGFNKKVNEIAAGCTNSNTAKEN